MKTIVDKGWLDSKPKVYAPVPYSHMKELVERNDDEARAELDAMRFKVLDGAHRVRAIRSLMKDPSVLLFDSETRITVEVARETRSVVQRSLDAAAENAKNTREFAKKTFNDDLWAMIGIQAEAVRRLVVFSTAVAEQPDAEVVHDPDPAAPTRKKGSSRKVTPLLSLPNLPEEGAGFIETYVSSIDSHLVVNKPGVQPYRRPFDPEAKKDRDLLYPSVLLALLADSHDVSLSSVLSVKNEGVKCKWRLLRMILPFHVEQTPIPQDDDTFIGGNGLVPNPDQDRRLWEYMCLVNDSLTSGSDDGLSYKRVYMTVFKQNAHKRILCGLLMMTQAVFTPSSTSSAVTGLRGRKSRISVPDKALEDVYATVCAIFRQYDKAALLLPSYNTVEDLILPYIVLDMNTFQFKVSTERDVWTNPAEFKSFDTDTYRTRTHPVFLTPFEDMDPVQKVKDDECRALAVSFLEDIERSRNVMSEENIRELVRDFGFFNAKGDNIEDSLHHSKITEYVRERFMVLRAVGFREAINEMDSKGDEQDEAAEDEESDGEPSTTRMRRTQPDADIHDAKTVCLKALEDVDDVRMFSCAFEDFSKRTDIESLFGKVALVLTDPPYNTRREAGASNSDYDKLSLSSMKEAADVIEKLLRPHGHAFIFCSFKQAMEWRSALESAGGGSSLKLPAVPEVIIRNNTAIHSAGRFLYHRVNAYETAWHAYKDKAGGSQSDYCTTVGFGNTSIELCSGTTLPPYCNVINNYVPPKGPELIRSNGRPVRAEQKSVKLLQDVMRLFAPKPTDIVVDLFAGTMSTVIAALIEGRPVYACEKDPDCFKIGESRVHNFQYRRGAAGLLSGLSPHQITLLRSAIPSKISAPDSLKHEPDTYETELAEMED
jgi:DNA modification methylase